MEFKYHNIKLLNDEYTINSKEPLFVDQRDVKITLDWIKDNYKWGSDVKIMDLGALEGGYSIDLAICGFTVIAIEARKANCDTIKYSGYSLKLDNLTVIQKDIKTIDTIEPVDIMLCLGVLYHLDKPLEFLKMAAAQTKDVMILNTHYSSCPDFIYDNSHIITRLGRMIYKRVPFLFPKVHNNLSQLDLNESYAGRWYKEYDLVKSSRQDVEQSREAAFSNYRSFWPLEDELYDMIHSAGFTSIQKIYDKPKHDRGIYICKK